MAYTFTSDRAKYLHSLEAGREIVTPKGVFSRFDSELALTHMKAGRISSRHFATIEDLQAFWQDLWRSVNL